jgi:predicted HTH transcriptional regulator
LDDREFLTKLKLASYDDEGLLRPTVSGLLMACERPEAFMPNAYIYRRCVTRVNIKIRNSWMPRILPALWINK